jgi:hypothetical protein
MQRNWTAHSKKSFPLPVQKSHKSLRDIKMKKNLADTTASLPLPEVTMRWVFSVRLRRTVFTSSTHPFRVRR